MTVKYALGRLKIEDEQDRKYPMSTALLRTASSDAERRYKYWWPSGWWGNQGSTPHCVAYSWMHFLEDGPITHFYEDNNEKHEKPLYDTTRLYREAQQVDRWPGELYDGTSVRAGAKVLRHRGIIAEYRWAWDIETVIQALLHFGPVVVGTYWYDQMFFPDGKGRIKVEGSPIGGHAYLLNGVNLNKGTIRLKNSWGQEWGRNGHAYISIEDMSKLIQQGGEACIALETKLPTE